MEVLENLFLVVFQVAPASSPYTERERGKEEGKGEGRREDLWGDQALKLAYSLKIGKLIIKAIVSVSVGFLFLNLNKRFLVIIISYN